jgi:tRNA dimethylallyltransferase
MAGAAASEPPVEPGRAGLPVVAVVGPTATGKSHLAVAVAARLGGEVVNADAMQLYRGMDVGTDKLPPAERRGVPHHLLDVWPVTYPASVADYQRRARAVVDRLLASGVPPVLVGGSGLYLRAVLDDLRFPGTDPVLRARLLAELAGAGPAALHARLSAVDPAAAAAILPSNGRRLVRALEVIEITGRPFTARLPDFAAVYPAVQIGLDLPDAALDARIADRTGRMWRRGLVAEVRQLVREGLREGPTARRALGYAQVLDALDGGLAPDETQAAVVRATRRFARRQRSWFRRDGRVRWLPADAPDVVGRALEVVEGAVDEGATGGGSGAGAAG